MGAKENLLKYVRYETTSDEESSSTPSTKGQMMLAEELERELKALGLETNLDENGYLFGYLKGNTSKKVKKLGFLAHLDTSPDMSGKDVSPRELTYAGGDIVLNEGLGIVLKTADFPDLKKYEGHDLIVTDGTTLLGADNKAGIAEIMAALEIIVSKSDMLHGDIMVAFTPDEEIGRGPHKFDVERFGAEIAYTIDGGPEGELEFENFNAAAAKVTFNGRNVHPGTAKGKMINSIAIAMEYASYFDKSETPEMTEKYEGFFHLNDFSGSVEKTVLNYIIRDFFPDTFEAKKQKIKGAADKLNEKYGQGTVTVEMKDQYRNMKEMIEPNMYLIDNALKAMEKAEVKPIVKPIRGGTDGAQLSFMGLPCPNIFTGGENYHGKFEFISIPAMEKAVKVIVNLVGIFEEQGIE
jgi:tripeptide aminopeptidase